MIRPFRQAHRWIAIGLMLFVTTTLIVGIMVRRPVHTTQDLPAALLGNFSAERYTQVVSQYDQLWPDISARVRVLKSTDASMGWALELSMIDQLIKPDLLVYWSSKEAVLPDDNSLPPDSVFLGTFYQSEPSHLPLPKPLINKQGRLILYSLPYQEMVALSEILTLGR